MRSAATRDSRAILSGWNRRCSTNRVEIGDWLPVIPVAVENCCRISSLLSRPLSNPPEGRGANGNAMTSLLTGERRSIRFASVLTGNFAGQWKKRN